MQKKIIIDYYHNFTPYKAIITYKKGMRRVNYRYDASKATFFISAPFFTSQKFILKYLDKFSTSLIEKTLKRKPPIIDNQIYIYGKLIPIEIANKNELMEDKIILKKNDDLSKTMKKYFLLYLNERVNYYRCIMNIEPYKISVRNARTRYGSNSRNNKSLSFALALMHFSKNAIDSVIIHELAHDIHFDHSSAFYEVVYKYCPNYKNLHRALNNCDYTYE